MGLPRWACVAAGSSSVVLVSWLLYRKGVALTLMTEQLQTEGLYSLEELGALSEFAEECSRDMIHTPVFESVSAGKRNGGSCVYHLAINNTMTVKA